jgi:hypothetical protein
VRLGLSLRDYFPQQIFQADHIIVLEHPHAGPAQAHTEAYARVVQLVGDDQAALADQCRDVGRIGGESL